MSLSRPRSSRATAPRLSSSNPQKAARCPSMPSSTTRPGTRAVATAPSRTRARPPSRPSPNPMRCRRQRASRKRRSKPATFQPMMRSGSNSATQARKAESAAASSGRWCTGASPAAPGRRRDDGPAARSAPGSTRNTASRVPVGEPSPAPAAAASVPDRGPVPATPPLTAIDQSRCSGSVPSSPEVSMSRETKRRSGRKSPARTRGSTYSTNPSRRSACPLQDHRTGHETFHQEPVRGPHVGFVDLGLAPLAECLELAPRAEVEGVDRGPGQASRALPARRRTPEGDARDRGMKQTASWPRSTARTGPCAPVAQSTSSSPRGVSRQSRVRRKTSAVESMRFPALPPRRRPGCSGCPGRRGTCPPRPRQGRRALRPPARLVRKL